MSETTTEEEVIKLPPPEPKKQVYVSEQEKENFFKAFLADKPFVADVPIFSGQATLSLKNLSVEEANDIVRQMALDQETGKAKVDDVYFATIQAYRLGLAVVAIDGKPFLPEVNKANTPIDAKAGTSYVSIRADAVLSWQDYKMAGIFDVYRTFEDKVVELTNQISSETFWKAAV